MREREVENLIVGPEHARVRKALRTAGLLLTALGLVMTAVGLISFFSSIGTFEPPRYFWCAIVGLPLMGLGWSLTSSGYAGAFVRYWAGETAPVRKDTFNYLAEGTSAGVNTLARAVGEGLRAGPREAGGAACPKCAARVPSGSRFCPHCGHAIAVELCAGCGAQSVPGAKFCHHCGAPLEHSEIA